MEGGEKLREYFRKIERKYDYDDLKSEEKVEEVTSNIFDYMNKDERKNRAKVNKRLIEEKTVPVVIDEVDKKNEKYISDTIKTLKSTNSTRDFISIDKEYKEETINEIKKLQDERAEEIEEDVITRGFFEAKTEEEVDEQLDRLKGDYRKDSARNAAKRRKEYLRGKEG